MDKTPPQRGHALLTDKSPLTRALCRAAGLPDVEALMVALAHPMTEGDEEALVRRAGGHPAHKTRLKHLRKLAQGDGEQEETQKSLTDEEPLEKGTFWSRLEGMDFGGIKRVPGSLRHGARGMGSRGGKIFVNGAGHLQYGEPPAPFRAHVTFDEDNEHERHALEGLRRQGYSDDEIGNLLLYETGDERRGRAMAAASQTGGHPFHIERVYREKAEEAHRQFRAHPLHHMDNLTATDESGRVVYDTVPVKHAVEEPVYDDDGILVVGRDGKPKTRKRTVESTEQRPHYLVTRDKQGNLKHDSSNRPLDPNDVGKLVRMWNSLPKEQREVDAKWYDGEAKAWIKEVAEASGQPFLKVAALLCAGNQAMGWEMGQLVAAQQSFRDTLGITDANGAPRYLKGRFPQLNERIARIAATPNDKKSLEDMIRREFATDKLGNFLMNMVGAGDGRAATVDRHMLGIFGAKTRKNSQGGEDYVASAKEMEYYRRALIAAAHQVGTTTEGIQAATWVHFRNTGAKERARQRGQPEQLVGTVTENKNLPVMRAYIAQRLAEAREAKKAAPRPIRRSPSTVAAKSFRSFLLHS